jgi:hypothetical protein
LTSLNLANNNLGLARGWKPHAGHAGYFNGPNGEFQKNPPLDMSVIITLAGAIRDMGALAKLDIRTNNIGATQEGDLQRICVAGGIELAK